MGRLKFLIFAFTIGFCIMTIELTAARVLAPYVGASIYTWTSIIGIILLGLSVGNFIGGYLIDRYKSLNTIFYLYLMAIFAVILIIPASYLSPQIAQSNLSLPWIIILLSLGIFLIPSIVLGTFYPAFMKFYAQNTDELGKFSGKISAAWSLGSILGTFATGFFLISYLGTRGTIFLVSAILLLNAFFVKKIKISTAFFLLLVFFIGVSIQSDEKSFSKDIFKKESNYYRIRIAEAKNSLLSGIKFLILDADIHGTSGDIDHKFDSYPQAYPVFSIINKNIREIAVIGGGTYELSKNMARFYENSHVTTIEVDPEVQKAASEFFDIDQYSNLSNIEADGRVFFQKYSKKYDLIFSDAYNSFVSVPWHMTTLEFNNLVKSRLSKNGLYAVNFISALEGENSLFFKSVQKTFSLTFSNYYILAFGSIESQPQNIILIGVNGTDRVSVDEFKKQLILLPNSAYLESKFVEKEIPVDENAPILTDNFSPVDRLMQPLMKNYFHKHANFYYNSFF